MQRRLVWALALATLAAGCGARESAAPDAAPTPPPAAAAPVADATHDPQPLSKPEASPNGGAKLLLPSDFPTDLPIPEGLTVKSVLSEQPGAFVAMFTGERDPESVQHEFDRLLEAQGWTIETRRTEGLDLGLFATKDGRIASVITTRLDGHLHVEVGVSGGLSD